MGDLVLGYMREAKAQLLLERDEGHGNREHSVTITQLETAILWRQEVLRLREPPVNEDNS